MDGTAGMDMTDGSPAALKTTRRATPACHCSMAGIRSRGQRDGDVHPNSAALAVDAVAVKLASVVEPMSRASHLSVRALPPALPTAAAASLPPCPLPSARTH